MKTRFLESQALFWYETVIREHESKHCNLLVLPPLLEWIFHSVPIAFFVILQKQHNRCGIKHPGKEIMV